MSYKSLHWFRHWPESMQFVWESGRVCFFLACLLFSYIYVTVGVLLKALDVWAMGVTLYCFVFGKASHLFTPDPCNVTNSSFISHNYSYEWIPEAGCCYYMSWLFSGFLWYSQCLLSAPSLWFSLPFLCSTCSVHLLTSTYWLCTIR